MHKENHNPFADTMPSNAPSHEALIAAKNAMCRFSIGASTGDWQPFLDVLTDDVSLLVPADGFAEKGLLKGKRHAKELFSYHNGVSHLNWHVRTLMGAENEVAFEAQVVSNPEDTPISLALLIIFVMEGEKVSQLREYAVYTGEDGKGWEDQTVTDEVFGYRSDKQSYCLSERADEVFSAWKKAIEIGDSSDLISMCIDDFVFAIPNGFAEWVGEQKGSDGFTKFIELEKGEIHEDMRIETISRMMGEQSACFEVKAIARSRETGEQFTAPLMVSFVFDLEGNVEKLHEWTWDLQTEAAAKQAGLID